MKTNRFVKKCGPYYVTSHSQGEGLVYARVYPAFPEYDVDESEKTQDIDDSWKKEPRWAVHRFHDEGGGPSIFGSMALGDELSKFLNSQYDGAAIKHWERTISKLLKERDRNTVFKQCKKCATVMPVPREWKFCPVCGNRLTQERVPRSTKTKEE